MAAPTLLDYAESTYTGETTPETTDDLNWGASTDVIVCLGATEDNAASLGLPVATGLTFTAMTGTPTNSASSCKGFAWSAAAIGDGNGTIVSTVSPSIAAGISAWAYSGSDGLGTAVVSVSTGTTVSVTVEADSSVVMLLADWNATTDVTVTTDPSGGTIRENTNVSGQATFLVIEWNSQAAGTRNYGVSAWTGTANITKIAVEVTGTSSGSTDLVIQEASQAQLADNVTITQAHTVAIQEATQAQLADNIAFTQAHTLVIQDALQTQSVDNLVITQVHQLVIQDSNQTQTVDNLTIDLSVALVISDSTQAQLAENLTITQQHSIIIQDSNQTQSADNIVFTQVHVLVIQDATQTQTVDNVAVTSGNIITPSGRVITVLAENRTSTVSSASRQSTVASESRVSTVNSESRTYGVYDL